MTGTNGGQRPVSHRTPGGRYPGHLPDDQLRELVREVLADVIGTMPELTGSLSLPGAPPSTVPHADAVRTAASLEAGLPGRRSPGQAQQRPRGSRDRDDADAWAVRISTDEELHAFVLRVLKLAGNPKLRGDLISGRARFRLAGTSAAATAATHRVEKGAVTERTVTAAAAAGARLVLGPRAVMTPLAKDKARALGVAIERPRGGVSDGRAPNGTEKER